VTEQTAPGRRPCRQGPCISRDAHGGNRALPAEARRDRGRAARAAQGQRNRRPGRSRAGDRPARRGL